MLLPSQVNVKKESRMIIWFECAEGGRVRGEVLSLAGDHLWSGLVARADGGRAGRLQPASYTFMVRKSEQIPAFEQTHARHMSTVPVRGGTEAPVKNTRS